MSKDKHKGDFKTQHSNQDHSSEIKPDKKSEEECASKGCGSSDCGSCKTSGRLKALPLALAAGLISGVGTLCLGWSAALGDWGVPMVKALGSVYHGYTPSLSGGIWGGLWGFIDGFFSGLFFAYLYNFFCCILKCCKCCKKRCKCCNKENCSNESCKK